MAAPKMWFGTRAYMTWVLCPAVNVVASREGWSSGVTQFLDGKAYIRRSVSSHKTYALDWEMKSRADVRIIDDFAQGIYGTSKVYWADPFALDTNMLSQDWASPFLGGHDGLILNGSDTRPTLTTTGANTLGYPIQSVIYDVGTAVKPSIWIPIPPGYSAWVGVTGLAGSGGVVQVTPSTGPTSDAAPVALVPQDVGSAVRVTDEFNSASYTGVSISLAGTGTVTLSALTVQLLRSGSVPATGGFISGQGHAGCVFDTMPSLTQYSAALDRVSLSAKLTETI